MSDSPRPKICYTASGMLVHDGKVLLVKHKKLGIWLGPGGHVDEDEYFHETAEREFWEETGIKVRAIDPFSNVHHSDESEYFPAPVVSNLHWVCKENYEQRIASEDLSQRATNEVWKRGCEQHLGLMYLVEAVDGLEFKQNTEETDGIGWFSVDELDELDTIDDIRYEARRAIELVAPKQ